MSVFPYCPESMFIASGVPLAANAPASTEVLPDTFAKLVTAFEEA